MKAAEVGDEAFSLLARRGGWRSPGCRVRAAVVSLAAVSLMPATIALGQLQPDELLLIYNTAGDHSRSLADHYARVRGVPSRQMLGLDMPLRESIRPDEYKMLAGRIRDFLSREPFGEKIRCLVTFYDVPLKVKAPVPTDAETKKQRELEKLRDKARQAFVALLKKTEASLGGEWPANAEARPGATRQTVSENSQTVVRVGSTHGGSRSCSGQPFDVGIRGEGGGGADGAGDDGSIVPAGG